MNNLKPIIAENAPGAPLIIAGPCSAETEEQVLSTARQLATGGINVFRAGIWKPRTKPGGFEGVGAPGLKWLKKVKQETGMLTATEVATRSHVHQALKAGIDILWIGARSAANPFVVQEIADTLGKMEADIPVLVKNPINPDLELWVGALQRLYNAGITRLGAIHRGFSTDGSHIYRNMPHWHISIELRLRYPELPIIGDPSHISGKRELVANVAQEALDLGFDGLIIEAHCSPQLAWSDSRQQLTPQSLLQMLNQLNFRKKTTQTECLTLLRSQIDSIDSELLEVLARRMEVSRKIGEYKKEHNMPVVQATRYNHLMQSRIKLGQQLGMSEEFLQHLLLAVHDESVRQQIQLIAKR